MAHIEFMTDNEDQKGWQYQGVFYRQSQWETLLKDIAIDFEIIGKDEELKIEIIEK